MYVVHDLLYSLRSLRKSAGFTLVVIVTLALGIGANTAVFSLIHLLLPPLPYRDPSHLLRLFEAKSPNDYETHENVAPANFLGWQQQTRAFADMAASIGFRYNLTGSGQPEQVWGDAISADWFTVLGVVPVLGRDFRREEDSPAGTPVVILSNNLWRRRFDSDPGIVGKTIGLNGDSFTVIGIMPQQSTLNPDVELWVPLQRQIRPDRMLWRDSRFLYVLARAKPGVSRKQAAADLNRVAAAIRRAHPAGDFYGAAVVIPLQEEIGSGLRRILLVSFATVLLVLLVACANVASLMLLRITGRTREFATRLALGARSGDLVRQLLTEGICLGIAAGVVGLGVREAGKKIVLWLLAWQSPELSAIDLSWQVLLATFATAVLAGATFALLPALAVSRLKNGDLPRRASLGATVDVQGRRLRQGFVIAEIACSIVLLAGAGLLVRSFQNLRHQPVGFETDHRIVVAVSLPRIRYQRDADVVRFYDQVGDKVRALPGVENATFAFPLPLSGNPFGVSFKAPQDTSVDPFNRADLRLADSHVFTTLGIPLLHGRLITDSDTGDSEPVCLINLAMAKKFWPGQDPLGRLIVVTRDDVHGQRTPRKIVGIVGDTRERINEEPQPMLYVPYSQMSFFTMDLLVETRDSPAALRKSVAAVLAGVDPDQPIRSIENFNDYLPAALGDWTTALTLLGGLAIVAVLLTALGVFAVIGYTVRERTREIGIRMAVGATRNACGTWCCGSPPGLPPLERQSASLRPPPAPASLAASSSAFVPLILLRSSWLRRSYPLLL
ncbi:MAG TPA: ABC transporter permease [Candidatus Angelobacter sp.]|nr:ABC transporter permease [Candidatus Angelobacter sp.]